MLKLELQLEPRPLSTEGVKLAWRDWVILLLLQEEGLEAWWVRSWCGGCLGKEGGETRTGPEDWRAGTGAKSGMRQTVNNMESVKEHQ